MPDKWRAAVLGGLAEGEELTEVQHLDPEGRRLLQEEGIIRRVEELVAERSAPPRWSRLSRSVPTPPSWSSKLAERALA